MMTDADKRRAEAKSRLTQKEMDLREIMELDAGCRVLACILKELGLGRAVSAEELACLNASIGLLRQMSQASPKAAARILNKAYGMDE